VLSKEIARRLDKEPMTRLPKGWPEIFGRRSGIVSRRATAFQYQLSFSTSLML
jgi:hypothetical protein